MLERAVLSQCFQLAIEDFRLLVPTAIAHMRNFQVTKSVWLMHWCGVKPFDFVVISVP